MKIFQTGYKSPLLSNVLLIMKLTTFLLLVFSLHVSATGFGQERLNFRIKRSEISTILSQIEKETHYRFLYNNQLRGIRQQTVLSVENASIRQTLDALLAKTYLTYMVMENNLIVIKENEEKLALLKPITGKVTDENGAPLTGVTINVKGSSRGTTTNDKGVFSIQAEENDVLVFSYVGFDQQEVKVGDKTEVSVALVGSSKNLENIVVIGYGQVKKRDLTGAVVSLKGDEVKKVAAANMMESVQGKVPGVDIVRTSGAAGANVAVTIRGNRSIIAGNGPLYIVDGIQYTNYQDINPNDIQSMEVLKDASSTAIYGSRGANGVVIITTKKGVSGKVKISASAYYGVSDIAGYPKPMTGPEYANLKRQAYRTAGKWNSVADDANVFTSQAERDAVNNGVSTYWPGLLLNKGSQQDYNIGVSSGTDKTKVYFSFDYFKEKGLLNNDFSGRYTLRLNIDQAITNNFRVGLSSQLTYYNQNLRQDNILTVANKVIPYYTPYNADTLVKYPGNANQVNPLLEELPGAYVNKFNITRILSTAYAEWKPFKELTIRSNLGIVNGSLRNFYFLGANTIDRALSSGSLSKVLNSTQTDLTWENVISWQKKIGEHNIDLTAVTSYLSYRTDSSYAQGTGQLLAAQEAYSLGSNPANLAIWSNYIGSNLMSGALRLNYSYKGKYLLTLTGRADGSSVLAKDNRWAFFPSAAAAWRISDEAFMMNQDVVSDLKLRLSYGVAGNSAVKPYQTQSAVMLIPDSWNDQSVLAYGLNPQIGNPDLKWELTNTANAGVDLGFLRNRITASVDYYDSRTHDLLFFRQLPATSGASLILQNIGKTHNYGIEVALRTINIEKKNFTWSSSFTYMHNTEKIVEVVGKQNDIVNNLFIGYPVRSFYDYEKIGIWQTADSSLAKTYGYKPGDIRVKDQDNDKVINANNDRKVIGSAVPRYSIGFGNDITFHNFDFNIYLFARVGQTFVSDYANKFEPNAIENGASVNYWTPENPTNDYPRPNSNISRAAMPFATTLGYKDGSFLKIRNITLGYTVPERITKRFRISSLRWYVSAKNFFTFSKVKDYDPEGAGSFERPLTKLIVTGLNLDF
ncbi:MAG: TonB-dependent receptor [Chitinophagaceae bacterium]